jgi:hypothetical protein
MTVMGPDQPQVRGAKLAVDLPRPRITMATEIGYNNAEVRSREHVTAGSSVVIDLVSSVRGPLCADLNECRQCW